MSREEREKTCLLAKSVASGLTGSARMHHRDSRWKEGPAHYSEGYAGTAGPVVPSEAQQAARAQRPREEQPRGVRPRELEPHSCEPCNNGTLCSGGSSEQVSAWT